MRPKNLNCVSISPPRQSSIPSMAGPFYHVRRRVLSMATPLLRCIWLTMPSCEPQCLSWRLQASVFSTSSILGMTRLEALLSLNGVTTHDAVWLIMDKWTDVPANSSRLLGLISVQGRSLLEWMAAAGYSPSSPTSYQLARNWLKQWSMDLAVLSEDHNARNNASYRPQNMTSPPDNSTRSVLRFLAGLWEACEPSGFEHFRLLDWHLLRRAVEWSYFASTNCAPTGPQFAAFVDGIISRLQLADSRMVRDFLLKRTQPTTHPLFVQAKKKAERRNQLLQPIPVFARALLLLRLASSAAEHLFEGRPVSSTELAFWANPFGEQRGLWDAGNAPDQMGDLWADVRPSLEIVAEWSESALPTSNIHQARRSLADSLAELSRFERVALWAVGL